MMLPLLVLSFPRSIERGHGFLFPGPLDCETDGLAIQHVQLRACPRQTLVIQKHPQRVLGPASLDVNFDRFKQHGIVNVVIRTCLSIRQSAKLQQWLYPFLPQTKLWGTIVNLNPNL